MAAPRNDRKGFFNSPNHAIRGTKFGVRLYSAMSRTPDFHEEMDRLQGHLPDWAGRNVDRLRRPRAIWVRVPAGLALIGGGVVGFLPVLGFWMVPLGLALLAVDVPPMRRPLAHALRFTNGKIEKYRNSRSGGRAGPVPRDR